MGLGVADRVRFWRPRADLLGRLAGRAGRVASTGGGRRLSAGRQREPQPGRSFGEARGEAFLEAE